MKRRLCVHPDISDHAMEYLRSQGYEPYRYGERVVEFSDEDKLKEIAREIALRRAVYPKWVRTGKMKQDKADRQIAIMLEIAKDYGGHGDKQ